MSEWDELRARLLREKRRNVNLLNFFDDYPVLDLRVAGDSALICGRSDRDWWYVSSSSEAELRELLKTLQPEDRCFAGVEDWMLPILSQDRQIAWILSTYMYFLPDDVSLPQTETYASSLEEGDASAIYSNSEYKEYISVEYVQDRIRRGTGFAVRDNGSPVAWILTQDDGAMGFLHVLPGYRKRGYGRSLTIILSRLLRQKAKIPFACVKETNIPAIRLVADLSFVKDKQIHWLELQSRSR